MAHACARLCLLEAAEASIRLLTVLTHLRCLLYLGILAELRSPLSLLGLLSIHAWLLLLHVLKLLLLLLLGRVEELRLEPTTPLRLLLLLLLRVKATLCSRLLHLIEHWLSLWLLGAEIWHHFESGVLRV